LSASIPAVAGGNHEALDTELSTFVAGVFTPVSAAWRLPLFVEVLLRAQSGQGRPLS
jgi:hypothetical protein